ncbi:MAG: prolyl aminopeptidase [Cypionkella sp.]
MAAQDQQDGTPGFHFDVGDGHQLWVETAGDPGGIPAVFLHGGPGSGFQPGMANLFDPARFRTVFFDQRGAGRSLPRGEMQANTTAHLIADIERLRLHFGVEKWLVVGGSWGATLALAYAQTHPERVSGLVLRAVFLGTAVELDWAFGAGLSHFYPALHQDFLAALPEAERHDPLPAYYRRILDLDPEVHLPAALAWHDTERILSEIAPAATRLTPGRDRGRPNSPFVEAHYFQNGCFMPANALLDNAHRLAGIAGVIVQGRYDLLCPPATSFALAQRWPEAEIFIAPVSGHSLSHPAIHEAVKAAIARFDGNGFGPVNA